MSMKFNEAASHAKQMKRFFHAFEKLEEVVRVASRAEQATTEAMAAKVKLDAELSEQSKTLGEQLERKQAMDAELVVLSTKVNAYKAGSVTELKAFLDATEAKKEATLAEVARAVEAANAEAAEVKSGLTTAIEALGTERAAAEKELVRVEGLVSSLQQSVGGLG